MSGKGTPFESMSHEEMLAWLDQANAGEVQSAADRLTAAAKEIRKIGEELKVRPQWVEWKGEGADAFRAWANDLANSTLRLGDFSEGAGKWLGHASDAIATVQASIPRDAKSSQANLDAAISAHNDPDSASVRAKSAANLAALKADQEKVRQEAADQMNKLGQSYEQSASQMNKLERPKFPPPPEVITPGRDHASEYLARPGSETSSHVDSGGLVPGSSPARVETVRAEHRGSVSAGPELHSDSPISGSASHHLRPPATDVPATHIDSTTTLPEAHRPPQTSPVGPPTTVHPETGSLPPTSGPVPPMPSGPVRLPSASGGSARSLGGRPGQPVQGPVGRAVGRQPTGVTPALGRSLPNAPRTVGPAVAREVPTSGTGGKGSGITGGRPITSSGTGRASGRMPGVAPGGEPTAGRGTTGRLPNTGATGQPATRSVGPSSGRPGATAREGIIGGTPQRTGRAPARPGAPVPSAPMRGGISGGVPSETRAGRGDRGTPGGPTSRARQRNDKQRDDRRNEPPTTD